MFFQLILKKSGTHFTIIEHLNLQAKFSLDICNLYSDILKFTV